jgi:rhodanese-related sulfurtransferase
MSLDSPTSERLDHAAPRTFEVSDLREMQAMHEDVLIIDVRTPAEFETAHIAGAYNVPLDTLGEHREEIARHVDRTVVLVCRSGQRATLAEQRLAEVGMTNVHVLAGGVVAWEAADGPLVRGRQRWTLERQVRLVAGSIVLASIVVSVAVPGARFVAGAVGAGLTFAALSDTCAMGMLLAKLPYNRSDACNTDRIVAELTRPSLTATTEEDPR